MSEPAECGGITGLRALAPAFLGESFVLFLSLNYIYSEQASCHALTWYPDRDLPWLR